MDTTVEKISIVTSDGLVLGALVVMPAHRNVTHTVQFNAATGVKKEYYLNFARYLAEMSCRVVLFDYRGIGASRPASLKGFKATMLDWGMQDMTAVTSYILQQYTDTPLVWVGHSVGGQMAGFSPYTDKITRVVAINTSTGYWKNFPFPYNLLSLFLWKVFIPVTTRLMGYAPTSAYKLGEDLPTGVARQWGEWCMNEDHFEATLRAITNEPAFTRFKAPLTIICPGDDYITQPANITRFAAFYPSAPVTIVNINAQEYKTGAIGHVGFFRSKMKAQYWPVLSGHILGQ